MLRSMVLFSNVLGMISAPLNLLEDTWHHYKVSSRAVKYSIMLLIARKRNGKVNII